ncbi:MAG: GYD domain-containing protein [Acidimicrobiales bacterium]
MPRFVIYAKYTPAALTEVRKAGYASREAQMRALPESLGGKLEAAYFMPSTQWDFMAIMELPSSAAAFAMASLGNASGSFERADYAELFSADEADAAIAASTTWSPPGR